MSASATTVQIKATKTQKGRKPIKRNAKKTMKVVLQPSRCRTALNQGIYISPPRIKNCLDGAGINCQIEDAINELRDAEPHDVDLIDAKTNKPTGKTITTTLITWDNISDATKAMVKRARTINEEIKRENAIREQAKADKLAEDIKAGRVDPVKLEAERKAAEVEKKTAELEAAKLAQARAVRDAERRANGHPVRGPKKVTPYSEEIELLSKIRIRFAKESASRVAASWCLALHELMRFGINNALKQERKIFKVRHIFQDGIESLVYSCLYRNLDSFKIAHAAEAARLAEEAKSKDEKTKEDEKSKEDEDSTKKKDDKYNFGHYIKQVCHNIMNEELDSWKPTKSGEKHPYEDIRVSKEIRDFGSQLTLDFTKRMCPLLRSQTNAVGVKTVGPDICQQVLTIILEHAGVDSDDTNTKINEKIAKYSAWVAKKKEDKKAAAAAKTKKADASADDAKKAAKSDESDGSDHDETDHEETDDEDEQ